MRIGAPESSTDSSDTEYFDFEDNMDIQTQIQNLVLLNENLRAEVNELRTNQQHANHQPANQARPPSLKGAPTSLFFGKNNENVTTWLFQLNGYFQQHRIPDDLCISHAATLLREGALQWYHNQVISTESDPEAPIKTWPGFQDQIKKAYRSPHHWYIIRKQMLALQQTGRITEYVEKFRSMAGQINNMAEEDQIVYFIEGLKERTRAAVETQVPKELETAIRLAAAYDEANFGYRLSSYRNRPATTQQNGVVPMDLTLVHARTPLPRLTDEEREECMRRGLCFRCRQAGHITRNCPGPKEESGNDAGRA
jgi:hypothetical protein